MEYSGAVKVTVMFWQSDEETSAMTLFRHDLRNGWGILRVHGQTDEYDHGSRIHGSFDMLFLRVAEADGGNGEMRA